MRAIILSLCLCSAVAPQIARAGTVSVAVASNFTEAANELSAAFSAATGDQAVLSFGATGQFYAQITQGAPFEVFLAADDERPQRAVAEGFGVEGSVFTYAVGQLVLYSASPGVVTGPQTLTAGNFDRIAIANPQTAPYGAAAMEVMQGLGVLDALEGKIVQGQSIGQAFQFVATGNARLGFVALGQVALLDGGSRWIVPQDLYTPIRQDAVLLTKGRDNPAAAAFLAFLKGDAAQRIIVRHGYGLDER